MADIKHDEETINTEPAFASKRKPVDSELLDDDSKKQKLETPDIPEPKIDKEDESEPDEEVEAVAEEDDDSEDADDSGEQSNGKKAVIDRKGKGKMIEEEVEDDDDDDSSDGEGESDDEDSDLSDDPLAEVDLDNILPSRTRRRVTNPGVFLSNDVRNRSSNIGGDDDDSDDA